MIDYQIKGEIFDLTDDHTEAMKSLAVWLITEFEKRMPVHSTALLNSVRWEAGRNSLHITIGDEKVKYAVIQNFGGTTHPGIEKGMVKMQGFFWAMFYATGDEKWKWMAISAATKPYFTVKIKGTHYALPLQKEWIEEIKRVLLKGIVTTTKSVRDWNVSGGGSHYATASRKF